ncbi:MAG: DNA cytosine methyltransferase [Caldilineaceae bacterium]|nr:DNA cytosine methyltransferase [Caldilineaceae bacterium]
MIIHVFDFFAGCGGTSCGFKDAGLQLKYALDNDPDSKETFEHNLGKEVHFELADIRYVVSSLQDEGNSLRTRIEQVKNTPGNYILFCGCAPCQPFTRQNTSARMDDPRRVLLYDFMELIREFRPDLIFVENVPGIQKVQGKGGPFDALINLLNKMNYKSDPKIVAAQQYGVPQKRRRLILIASQLGPITHPRPTHGPGTDNIEYSTVENWIKGLPKISAGEIDSNDAMHRSANLSPTNLLRIQAIDQGQSRMDWPEELKLDCHSNGYDGHTDVYGRMWWGEPATGLTTRCISLSNGRFGHPDQDRAISIREAALLQTFPGDYTFKGSLASMARQIGNAVPVLLAQRFGEHFLKHVAQHQERQTT